jgi:hypothetical protein
MIELQKIRKKVYVCYKLKSISLFKKSFFRRQMSE